MSGLHGEWIKDEQRYEDGCKSDAAPHSIEPVDAVYEFRLEPVNVAALREIVTAYQPGDHLRVEDKHYTGVHFTLVRPADSNAKQAYIKNYGAYEVPHIAGSRPQHEVTGRVDADGVTSCELDGCYGQLPNCGFQQQHSVRV